MNRNQLEVWLDADIVPEKIRMGTLAHDRGHVRFNYDPGWLAHPSRFGIDPDLSLDGATFHPRPHYWEFWHPLGLIPGQVGANLDEAPGSLGGERQ